MAGGRLRLGGTGNGGMARRRKASDERENKVFQSQKFRLQGVPFQLVFS